MKKLLFLLSFFITNAYCADMQKDIFEAVGNNDLDLVDKYIQNGGNINITDEEEGKTLLMMAAKSGHLDMMKLLVNNGADLHFQNLQGATALMLACQYGQKEAVEFLINKKANLDLRDGEGSTALMIAVRRHINKSNEGKMRPITRSIDTGRSIWTKKDNLENIILLIKAKANLDIQDNERNTALMLALSFGLNDVALLLLEAGADHNNLKNKDNQTAKIIAIHQAELHPEKYSDIIKFFIDEERRRERIETQNILPPIATTMNPNLIKLICDYI